ncbi:hypothetical protein E1B28_009383 [Marasmius oreades]|uniref:Uncharacterized protein n=1 Tax=Marasmius oreades TaxID=181124 RepID=A0A9P7S1N2_9AGAR|nr:uncharacterized protein E1B28_009383 [Marasmius oreades]KAG7093096.1 hypothetical protein E1B28_009383 [Marasmius oreades]
MLATVHILSSKYHPNQSMEAEKIPIHQEKIEFNLCSQMKTVYNAQGNKQVKRVPTNSAVKLVKLLHDIRAFLDEMYPLEKRTQLAEVLQSSEDFSTMVQSCSDTVSASRATESARASKSKTKPKAPNWNQPKPNMGVKPRSISASGSRTTRLTTRVLHPSVPEDREI